MSRRSAAAALAALLLLSAPGPGAWAHGARALRGAPARAVPRVLLPAAASLGWGRPADLRAAADAARLRRLEDAARSGAARTARVEADHLVLSARIGLAAARAEAREALAMARGPSPIYQAAAAARLAGAAGRVSFDGGRPGGGELSTAFDAWADAASRPELDPPSMGGGGSRRPPEPPGPGAPKDEPGIKSFLWGLFANQVANGALQVLLPLALLDITGSIALTAAVTLAAGWLDTAGTALGGWLADRWGDPKAVLILATGARVAATAGIVALLLLGPGAGWAAAAAGLAVLDGLARGVADTARSVMPAALAGGDGEAAVRRLDARRKKFMSAGLALGPALAGGLMLVLSLGGGATGAAYLLIPAAFAASFALNFLLPRVAAAAPEREESMTWRELGRTLSRPWAAAALLSTALLAQTLFKGLVPALLAGTLVAADPLLRALGAGAETVAPWLMVALGLGNWAGARWAEKASERLDPRRSLAWGALGTLAAAIGFVSGSFPGALAAAFVFGVVNMAARAAVDSALASRAPAGQLGRAVSAQRLVANLSGGGLKALVALAFAAAGAAGGLWWLAGLLVLIAGGQLIMSLRFGALKEDGHGS